MNEIDFKDIYIDGILKELKDDIGKQIDIENAGANTINYSKDKFLEADQKMRKVLSDILSYRDGGELENFNYNFLLLIPENQIDAKKRLRNYLILYYTALFFNNVKLLQRLIRETVCFDLNSDYLRLELLDSKITSLFEEDEYIALIKKKPNVLSVIYHSTMEKNYYDKRKYFKKFADIIKVRKDLVENVSQDVWRKEVLDTYDEETYLKASIEQLNVIMTCNYNFNDEKLKKRANRLIQETDFGKDFLFYVGDLKKLLVRFTDEELKNMDKETVYYFVATDVGNLLRVKELVRQRPGLVKYMITCSRSFLNIFSDKEILMMSDEVLKKVVQNSSTLFPDYEGTDARKVKRFVGMQKIKNRLLPGTINKEG